ncbi:MAG: PD-(D/E)XK nuclease family transposase [Prolixibacteraceae bacterium]
MIKIKYIDPFVDVTFKKIFGSEPNRDLLIFFLNELFRGSKRITDLVYNTNDHPGYNDEIGAAMGSFLLN